MSFVEVGNLETDNEIGGQSLVATVHSIILLLFDYDDFVNDNGDNGDTGGDLPVDGFGFFV